MLSKNTTFTIGSKFIILLANFALVVFSTQRWGSEGRGEIALVIANISIITIFSNIFCGSTIAYHAPRLQRDFLLAVSLAGAIIISIIRVQLFFQSCSDSCISAAVLPDSVVNVSDNSHFDLLAWEE